MVKKKQPCIVDTLTSLSFNFIITQKLWQHLTLDQISYCHHLTPFREKEHYYIELVLAWIEHSDPSQTTVSEIWATFDYQRLSEMYLEDVKEHLLLLGYTVPAAPQCVYSNDTEAWFWSRAQRCQLEQFNMLRLTYRPCKVKQCPRRTRHAVNMEVASSIPCYRVDNLCPETRACHVHQHSVTHWWGSVQVESGGTRRDKIISMVTNSREEFFNEMNSLDKRYSCRNIACMVLVNARPRSAAPL